MTEAVQVALITGATTVISVTVSRWLSAREHRQTVAKVDSMAAKTDSIEVNINGRMSKIIELLEEKAANAAITARAEGLLEGQRNEKT